MYWLSFEAEQVWKTEWRQSEKPCPADHRIFFSNRHYCSAFDQYFPVLIEEKKWKWKTIEAQKSESEQKI